ncbi:unnamed protein product [Caenorhabditis auriculariae]|uniref:WD repeat-containing protein 60 n=1 Tax=Caenorhabditis auriculariae TaxID=2777116 RepID=A0A8S1GZD0_9PELO|nr:unnamed protein product [Caenorhabditis auriculariae]
MSSRDKKGKEKDKKSTKRSDKKNLEDKKKKKEKEAVVETYYEDDFEDETEEIVEKLPESTTSYASPSSDSFSQKVEEFSKENTLEIVGQPQTAEYESEISKRVSKRQLQQENHKPFVPSRQAAISLTDSQTPQFESRSRANDRLNKLKSFINVEITRCQVLDNPNHMLEKMHAAAPNVSHAYAQTGNEDLSEEVQTETRKTESVATQCPAADPPAPSTSLDRSRLSNFLFAAARVLDEVLGSTADFEETEMREKSELNFSIGFNLLQLGAVAKSQRVFPSAFLIRTVQASKATCVFKGDNDTLYVSFEIFESLAQDLTNNGLVVEFPVHGMRPPSKLFVVQDAVMSITKSTRSTALFVALRDGTFCAFDLLAAESTFDDTLPWPDSDDDVVLRRPSFDSSFLAPTIADASPLVSIKLCHHTNEEELCTLDARGTLSFWLVMRRNDEIKLNLSAVIRPHPHLYRSSPSFIVNCLTIAQRPLRFFMGTDTGIMYSVSRAEASNVGPRTYRTNAELNGEVTCMKISPFDSSIILIGLSIGKLAIYKIGKQSPIVTLGKEDSSRAVTQVEWSPACSTLFYSIHNGKLIFTWDLSVGTTALYQDIQEKYGKIVDACTWSSDVGKSGSRFCYMAIATDKGNAEIHALESINKKTGIDSLTSVLRKYATY